MRFNTLRKIFIKNKTNNKAIRLTCFKFSVRKSVFFYSGYFCDFTQVLGVTPSIFLKKALKTDFELNPLSYANAKSVK